MTLTIELETSNGKCLIPVKAVSKVEAVVSRSNPDAPGTACVVKANDEHVYTLHTIDEVCQKLKLLGFSNKAKNKDTLVMSNGKRHSIKIRAVPHEYEAPLRLSDEEFDRITRKMMAEHSDALKRLGRLSGDEDA